MAAATLTIKDDEVNAALQRLYDAVGDITPALKNIGEEEADVTRDRFSEEVDPWGRAWAPLNPLYQKTKKGPGILRGQTRDLSTIIWQLASEQSVEIGSSVIYARIHQEGGVIKAKNAAALVFSMGGQTFKRKSVTIPQRQFLGFNDESRARALAIVEDFLDAAYQGG
ncbi:phage virion morphogenesis protein [uncultured Cohaesibacter sp.]|uniref:phage virion morphogenesis protein n=1 Tax=uncultured Cohaesibacter sp. TaxID=1002546 RepID=UPI0029C8504C|nr:phage virion morphogenesis protein [uncultured Cohaesibacter sp.]